MSKNIYNDSDSKFEPLLKDLKNLPKVETDDNFTFNLMTKIQNGNFETGKSKKSFKGFSWSLIPASALALSAGILYFTLTPQQLDNPFSEVPNLRANVSEKVNSSSKIESFKKGGFEAIVNENDAVVKRKIDIPFDKNKSISVDPTNNPAINNYSGRAHLVKQESRSLMDFDGFYIRVDKDSVKRKKDSVRVKK